jgi:hypothetical protein
MQKQQNKPVIEENIKELQEPIVAIGQHITLS